MWWNKYLISQCIAICVMQLIDSVSMEAFITPEELFASLKKNDTPIGTEELPSDHFVSLRSTTIAPETHNPIGTPAPITSHANEDSKISYNNAQNFEEKSTERPKYNTADGTETGFKRYPEAANVFKDFGTNIARDSPNNNPSPQTFNTPQQSFTRPNTRNPSPQTFKTPQQSFTRPNIGVSQGFNPPILNPVQGFDMPEIMRHNIFIGPGNPQQAFNNRNINQNRYVQRTYTVPGTQNQNPSPQIFNTPQHSFIRPNTGVSQGFNPPNLNPVRGFNIPEIVRHNNFIGPGIPQQSFNNPNINQNGYVQSTHTVPGLQNQPSYTVTTYQSPTWSFSSDGGPTESFSSYGPTPFRIPNGFNVNDIPFEDNPFGDGFNGGTQTHRTGYHTVRTTGPDGRVREKTTVW